MQSFEEAFDLLCGEEIGKGMSRKVFACALLPDCVVKVEEDLMRFQNIMEWQTWNTVQFTKAARWFAECRWISPNGRILIQQRTRPPGPADLLEKVPAWFTDLKSENWGMAQSRNPDGSLGPELLVCHDYGLSLALQEGTTTKRMRRAHWHDR